MIKKTDLILDGTKYPLTPEEAEGLQITLDAIPTCVPEQFEHDQMNQAAASTVLLNAGYQIITPQQKAQAEFDATKTDASPGQVAVRQELNVARETISKHAEELACWLQTEKVLRESIKDFEGGEAQRRAIQAGIDVQAATDGHMTTDQYRQWCERKDLSVSEEKLLKEISHLRATLRLKAYKAPARSL